MVCPTLPAGPTKMTAALSEKLRMVSLLSIVMVVYIHTYYSESEGMTLLPRLEAFVGGGLCRAAVPMFYVISGYLFFLKCADGLRSIWGKMQKRVRTLLVPYLLANVLTFAFYVAVNLVARRVAAIDRVLNFHVLEWLDGGVMSLLKDVFWGPIAFQLWFVRDLMLVVVLSPLVYLWLRWSVSSRIGVMVFALVELVLYFGLGGSVGVVTALIWFALGGVLAMHPAVSLAGIGHKVWGVVATVSYVALCVAHALGLLPEWGVQLIAPLGVYGLWQVYDLLLVKKNYPPLSAYGVLWSCVPYTFFIYLVHEPLLNIFKKVPLLLSRTELTLTLCYLLIPPIFCAFAVVLGRVLRRLVPRLYAVYTGGR